MTNTERITANNAELREAIELAENLPDVGGVAEAVIEELTVTENGTNAAPDGVDGYSPITVNVEASGGRITHDDIATAGITGDIVLSTSSVAGYSFVNHQGITSLYAPNVTSVGTYAFYGTGLTGALDLSRCETIGNYAFCNSRGIESLSIPNVTSVGTNAFQYCNKITMLDAPNLTTLGGYAFSGNATYKMAFKSINLPKCTAIPASTLTYCANVTELVLPECTSVGNSALTNWTNLAFVDLPKCKSIANYGLRNNSKLETLILRSETLCTLSNYALNSSKIANGTGYVYVPAALVDTYKSATNWSKLASQFRAIEDYPEICGEVSA